MSKKQNKKTIPKPVSQSKVITQKEKGGYKFSFKLEIPSLPGLTPYLPGILLFLIALTIGLLTFRDYGMSYDEQYQWKLGMLTYDYVFSGSQELFNSDYKNYGPGFEFPLVFFEKLFKLSDSRDIFLMRHLTTHILFLISSFSMYVLSYKLFKNKFLASLGFIMLAFAPRIYAHSFFNTKDIPFLCMFVITLTFCKIAFEKNKPTLYFVVGLLAGYTTCIRIMGIMLSVFILIYLLVDLIANLVNKEKLLKQVLNVLSYSIGFCFLLYLTWPFLWKHPISNFIETIKEFSHYPWLGKVFIDGKYYLASKLPWTYFPIWFLITNPELWLIAGFAGILLVSINFFKEPLTYFKNTKERNFLLYLLCFFVPILAVIILHSVIYDDWRHLYFIYPSFVLLALYFIDKMLETRYKLIVQGACILQVIIIGFFIIVNHPFSQVYFNNLVSHEDEYLRNHYDLEYWGCSFKQGLDHLLKENKLKIIKVSENLTGVIDRNIMLLPKEDRKRIELSDIQNADFIITNFRLHPYDYPPYKIEYSISVLNSTILCVFKHEMDTIKEKENRLEEIANLNNFLAINPDIEDAQVKIGYAYFCISKYDSAEFWDNSVLKLNPNNTFALNNLEALYITIKKYSKALEILKNDVKIYKYNSEKYSDIGACYFSLGKYDSAIFYLNKSIIIDSNNNASYTNLAIIYKKVSKLDSAKKYEAIVHKYNPGFKL